MNAVINKLEEISADERMRELYRAREKSRLDMISKIKYAENKAREAGMEQGIAEGKKVVARKLLYVGLSVDQIVETTDLTIEEVMELQKEIDK